MELTKGLQACVFSGDTPSQWWGGWGDTRVSAACPPQVLLVQSSPSFWGNFCHETAAGAPQRCQSQSNLMPTSSGFMQGLNLNLGKEERKASRRAGLALNPSLLSWAGLAGGICTQRDCRGPAVGSAHWCGGLVQEGVSVWDFQTPKSLSSCSGTGTDCQGSAGVAIPGPAPPRSSRVCLGPSHLLQHPQRVPGSGWTADGQRMDSGCTPQPGVRCCSPATLAASGGVESLVTAVVTVTIVVLAGPGCQSSSSSKDCAEHECWSKAGERLGELGLLTGREGSRESSEPLPEPKGAPGELERDWGRGMEGQDTGNVFIVIQGRVRWDIGKELFPVRMGRPWHRVSRAAVAAPGSLAASKARLDRAWRSLGQWEVSLPWQGVEGSGLWGSFQPTPVCDSVTPRMLCTAPLGVLWEQQNCPGIAVTALATAPGHQRAKPGHTADLQLLLLLPSLSLGVEAMERPLGSSCQMKPNQHLPAARAASMILPVASPLHLLINLDFVPAWSVLTSVLASLARAARRGKAAGSC
ncbi:uncharacterized protein LOC121342807 [Onychostruthus taczanowskii]|uniref:uncharacterized protein LOC121342807 n=1 Tax=Onychostruthus taczanowskii TaxID=356909 RepID=UPI001B803FD4|nr:uncharacterized protein LOC121342807 [Onychostruthus taczanowskii]